MNFLLIIIVFGTNPGGAAIHERRFETMRLCEAAAAKISDDNVKAVCVRWKEGIL